MWEQVRSNRIRSVVLVASMAVLLLAVGWLLGEAFLGNAAGGLAIAAAILVVLNLVAFFQGDSIMLALARARKIKRDDHPRLYNIVEEMRIASGLEKMPDIYIIDDNALNAFATGRDPSRASVAVTAGLLQKLSRDELQGVIGHELAHIKNRDVLLMSLCGILLGTIVILAWYGSRIMLFGSMTGGRRSSRGAGGGQAQLLIMVVAIVLAILAPILAQLIYFAISRKREYMADASSALYTRYPEGLASALEKLAGSKEPVKAANKASAPMYIINPFRAKGRAAADLTSTHPPISERIRILRSMGGGGLGSYNQAYQEVHQKGRGRGLFGAGTLTAADTVGLRQAAGAESPQARGGAAAPVGEQPEPDRVGRTREVSDLMWRMNEYRTIDCECGTRLRIPPDMKHASVRCPHCGRTHPLKRS